MNAVVQLCLAAFGLSALAMALSTSERARRWAPLVGLAGQPFWLAFAWQAEAWGMLALSTAYSAVYAHAALRSWQGARAAAVQRQPGAARAEPMRPPRHASQQHP